MLIIIIGFVVAFLIMIFLCSVIKNNDTGFITSIVTGIILFAIVMGLFYPSKIGERKLIKQTELVSLSDDTTSEGKGLIYVSISGENSYTYRYEVDTDLGTKTSKNYTVDTISKNDGYIIESEDVNCEQAVLLEYKTKSKISIWSFGLGYSETEYVFYVPDGTIQKDVKLQ